MTWPDGPTRRAISRVKKPHAGTWFEHCHTGMDVRCHDRGWGLHEPPEGACKEPPNPPRADAVTSHASLCKIRPSTLRAIRYRYIFARFGLPLPYLNGAHLEGADLDLDLNVLKVEHLARMPAVEPVGERGADPSVNGCPVSKATRSSGWTLTFGHRQRRKHTLLRRCFLQCEFRELAPK
jgi:hypothetical protein